MPKLPHLSGREIVRILMRFGFEVIRQKGSHIVLRRGHTGCVVPDHREAKIGTLNGILKQAGNTNDEFVAALRD